MNLVELDETGQLVIHEELYGLRTFNELITDRRSNKKSEEYIVNELLYLYFMYDLRSDYMIYSDEEREIQVLEELDLGDGYKVDSFMDRAIRLYSELTQTKISTILKTTYTLVDKTNEYINDLDLNATDINGKPIISLKDAIAAGNQNTILAEKVAKLEELQSQQLKDKSKIRGNRTKSILEDL